MKLWPPKFLKKEAPESDFTVRDGRIIVNGEEEHEPNPVGQSLEEEQTPELQQFQPEQLKAPIRAQEKIGVQKAEEKAPEPMGNLPIRRYSPSFLTDRKESGDMGLYLHYLETQGYKDRTRGEYMMDLRTLGKNLDGEFPTADNIQRIMSSVSPHRAHRMLTSLKSYGTYRNFHGDPRIIILLATSQSITYPKKPTPKERETLSTEQLQMYQTSARELCSEGNRAGIWIGLSLFKVQSSEIKTVRVNGDDESIIAGKRNIKVPKWLIQALTGIDQSKWAKGRNTIRKGLEKYGTTPHTLYLSAVASGSASRNSSRKTDA